jgi:hypothetical protein
MQTILESQARVMKQETQGREDGEQLGRKEEEEKR